jgi:hypothetical protein
MRGSSPSWSAKTALVHLRTFSSTILPDGLDLLGKKGSKLVTLEVSEKRSGVCEGSGCRVEVWRHSVGAGDGCAADQVSPGIGEAL